MTQASQRVSLGLRESPGQGVKYGVDHRPPPDVIEALMTATAKVPRSAGGLHDEKAEPEVAGLYSAIRVEVSPPCLATLEGAVLVTGQVLVCIRQVEGSFRLVSP